MALTAPWSSGDDLRVLAALELGMSEYMRTGIEQSMNQMAASSGALVVYIQGELDRYEAAKASRTSADLNNPDSRVLTKADVLEWQVSHGSIGISRELMDAQANIRRAFADSIYVPQDTGYSGTVSLIRS